MSRIWSRRNLLHLCVGGLAALAGCSVMGSGKEPLTELFGGHPIAYRHESVRLSLSGSAVPLGETFEFTVTNTGQTRVTLGCGNPWTLQKYRDGGWHDVIWTSANGFGGCATTLNVGESRTGRVTVKESALETKTESVQEDLTPGQYRLVLLSTEPFLAEDFRVQTSD